MPIILIILGIIVAPYVLAIALYALSFIVCCVQAGIYVVENREYPIVERIRAEEAIMYNGEKYLYTPSYVYIEDGQEILPEYVVELNCEEERKVAIMYTPYLGIFPGFSEVFVSNFDENENILAVAYGDEFGHYYVKEGFELPSDVDNMAVETVFLDSYIYGMEQERVDLLDFGDGFTYNTMIATERETLIVNYDEAYLVRCGFVLEGYSFLRSCNFYLLEREGELYATRYEETEPIISNEDYFYAKDCYKIKAEYQAEFKAAYDQLIDTNENEAV